MGEKPHCQVGPELVNATAFGRSRWRGRGAVAVSLECVGFTEKRKEEAHGGSRLWRFLNKWWTSNRPPRHPSFAPKAPLQRHPPNAGFSQVAPRPASPIWILRSSLLFLDPLVLYERITGTPVLQEHDGPLAQ